MIVNWMRFWTIWTKQAIWAVGNCDEQFHQINWNVVPASQHHSMRRVSRLPPYVLCVPCLSHVSSLILGALHFHVPGVPLQPYPSSHTQYPSWDTKPMIPRSSLPFSTFVTFIPTFFVRLTSVCMSYPKLSQQLKWKSSLYPSDLRAITSCSLKHRCHVCCSSENLMVVLPFSPKVFF